MINLDNVNCTKLSPTILKVVYDNVESEIDDKIDRPLRKACGIPVSGWKVLFTSGRIRANEIIITQAIESYRVEVGYPHVIISNAEPISTILLLKRLNAIRKLDITIIPVDMHGRVKPEVVEKRIKHNTCLISIIYASDDTGAINDIQAIGEISANRGVPFHTDATHYFSHTTKLNILSRKISAMTIDASMFHGPKGIGALIIDEKIINGYNMYITDEILNPGLIYGMIKAVEIPSLRYCDNVVYIKQAIVNCIEDKFAPNYPVKYKKNSRYTTDTPEVVFMSLYKDSVPNIITFAIINRSKPFIAKDFVKVARTKNIIISVPNPHVMENMKWNKIVIPAAIRISLGCNTTLASVKKLIVLLFKYAT